MINRAPIALRALSIRTPRFRYIQKRLALAAWEGLEMRRLLSTAVWTGSAGDGLWSSAGNWAGDAVPTAGQDVQFNNLTGSGTPQIIQVNEAVEVGSMTMDNTILQGSDAITIDGNVTVGTSNYVAIIAPITLTHTTTLNVSAGSGSLFSDLLLCNPISDGGHGYGLTITGSGGGEVDIVPCTINSGGDASYENADVTENFTGPIDVKNGSILTINATLGGGISASGNSQVFGSGTWPTVDQTDSQFGATDIYGLYPGVLTITDGLHLAGGGIFTDTINGTTAGNGSADTGFSEVDVKSGTIDLASQTFEPTIDKTKYTPNAGDVITVIKNQTGHAISGTFANLAEGAHVDVSGYPFVISYKGGTSGKDVTLTAQSIPTIRSTTSTGAVTGVSGVLSVVGADPDSAKGSKGLTYEWSVVTAPKGAKTPHFTLNGTNAAKDNTVRFYKAGTYDFECTATNAGGGSASVIVHVVVAKTATVLRIVPHGDKIAEGASVQYTAAVLDQFNHSISATPSFSILSGPATITTDGLLTAGDTTGIVDIRAEDDGLAGTVGATVVA